MYIPPFTGDDDVPLNISPRTAAVVSFLSRLRLSHFHHHLQFAMKPNYLHIWPRNTFMMIALPNLVSVNFLLFLLLHYTTTAVAVNNKQIIIIYIILAAID